MWKRGWWALVALPFVEVAVTVVFTRWIGAGWTFLLFVVPAVTGLLVQWLRYPRIKLLWSELSSRMESEGKEGLRRDPELLRRSTEVLLFWFAVALLLIPGLASHVIAFGLIAPWTRALLIQAMVRADRSRHETEPPA